jgi:hypothetical protein
MNVPADVLAASADVRVQVNEPVLPAAGGVQAKFAGGVMETKVVPVGIVSVTVRGLPTAAGALAGPTFWMVCEYVIVLPATTASGVSLSVDTSRSGMHTPLTMMVAAFEMTLQPLAPVMTQRNFLPLSTAVFGV